MIFKDSCTDILKHKAVILTVFWTVEKKVKRDVSHEHLEQKNTANGCHLWACDFFLKRIKLVFCRLSSGMEAG